MALMQTTTHLSDLHIRQARAEDASEIARLFLISSDGLAGYIWSKLARPGQSLDEVGAARYARTGTAFSYQNCLLAFRRGAVVGMAHAYPMPQRGPDDIDDDPVMRPYAELEDPGSLYVAGLAVHDGHRGRGIGGVLMESVEGMAIVRGCPRVTLICFEQNETAMALYRGRGYREIARRPIVPHPSLRYARGDALLLARRI